MEIKKVLKHKVVFYLSSRYLTYFIQFITSLLIADRLGPYYLGIWGFVLLLLNYFGQIHFGISTSFNILYIHNKDDEYKKNSYIANSILLNAYLAIAVAIIFIVYKATGGVWFEKFDSDKYFLPVCIIAILQYFQQFLTFLFRVKNKLGLVILCQSLIVIFNFIAVLLFRGEAILNALICGYLLGYLIVIITAFFTGDLPKRHTYKISSTFQKEILKKGIYLFLFNSSFYFIVISIRSIVSSNYSVEEFGMFTFSFTMAQAVMLLIESLNFVIFPKVVYKLSSPNNNEVLSMLETYRISYITTAHLLIYMAMLFFPLLINILPKYGDGLTALNLIALCVLMNTCSAGYSTLLISRNKELLSALLSALALLMNILIALFFVKILHVGFDYVILATLITYFLYAISVTYFGNKELKRKDWKSTFLHFFPLKLFVPYIVALIISIYKFESFMMIPMLLFLVLNFNDFKSILSMGKQILNKPDTLDFK